MGKNSTVYDCSIIELDKHHSDRKGSITVVENGKDVPFDVKRSYNLYDMMYRVANLVEHMLTKH